MEFFDYFTRLFGMDPTQLPVYLRVMTFIVPVVFVVFFVCLIVSKVKKAVKVIRHVTAGIRVKEDSGLSADEVRKISVGALYAYQQGGYVDVMDPDVDESRLSTILSEWWDINDRDSAIETVNYLGNATTQNLLPLVYSAFNASSKDEAMRIITDTVTNDPEIKNHPEGMELAKGVIGKAENQLDNLKSEYDSLVNDGIISSASDIERLGVIAWDAGRLNFVARAAMQKGYITQEECQHCVDHAYEMSLSAGFNSWKDFANSYMLGRVMWNGDNNMGALAEDLLTKPNSPWVRFPWKFHV